MDEFYNLTYAIRGCAFEVYKTLGPGLLESTYEKAMMFELKSRGLKAVEQVPISVFYKGHSLGLDYRIDILVEDKVILELKSVEEVLPVHLKQLLTYLRLTGKHVGFLMNFNENDFRKGIFRKVNNLEEK